jgi:hypothetical protein
MLSATSRFVRPLFPLPTSLSASSKTQTLCSETSQAPVRDEDNVLIGQGYSTPHGAVTDEYGAVVEW